MEGEEQERFHTLEENIPPGNPKIEQIKRQLFACSSTIIGAAAAGICSHSVINHFAEYKLELGYSDEYIFYHPTIGDVGGIIVAIPLLYFVGRRYALILSQLFFLLTLLVYEYYHEQASALYHNRLAEEFTNVLILHGCVRVYAIVMVVYVVEIAQPAYRALLVAAFFPPFIFGLLYARVYLDENKILLAAIAVQIIAFVLALTASESPYWLALRGRMEDAEEAFMWLRANVDEANELDAVFEKTERAASTIASFAAAFFIPLMKMAFMYMATDSVCRVFMAHLTYPLYFFKYDNTYEHEIEVTDEPVSKMYTYPVIGSLLFLVICPFAGRRILYMASIFMTFVIFLARWKYITLDMAEMRVRSAEICYFVSHLGAMQVMLLLPGEIFPGNVKELGVAVCEFMQFGLTLADYKYCQWGKNWTSYSTLRLIMIPFGIILTFFFMPETKDLTLVETEEAGVKMAPVIRAAFWEGDVDESEIFEDE